MARPFGRTGWRGVVAVCLLVAAGSAAPAQVTVRIEAAGVQSRSAIGGVTFTTNDFNATTTGSYSTALVGTGLNGVAVGSTYTPGTGNSFNVLPADVYGGAGGIASYFRSTNAVSTLSVAGGGLHYFGFWFSAIDGSETVSLLSGGTAIFTLTGAQLTATGQLTGGYLGNPNSVGGSTGGNAAQPYVFVDLYLDNTRSFDSVQFSSATFESDNHTYSTSVIPTASQTGTLVPVPEPAAAGLAVTAGLGLVRLTHRRRDR